MAKKKMNVTEQAAFSVTKWVGSMQSIALHTGIFIAAFLAAYFNYIDFDEMLLVLTTVVSLEAIYLAIFIQMSVNRTSESLEEVEHDIDEIQRDVDEIQEEEKEEMRRDKEQDVTLEEIREKLTKLALDLEKVADQASKK